MLNSMSSTFPLTDTMDRTNSIDGLRRPKKSYQNLVLRPKSLLQTSKTIHVPDSDLKCRVQKHQSHSLKNSSSVSLRGQSSRKYPCGRVEKMGLQWTVKP